MNYTEATDGNPTRHPIKARYDLIDWEVIHAMAEGLGKGAANYGDRNWEKARMVGVDSPLNHAMKHLSLYMAGVPDDDGDDHLINAMMNLMFEHHYNRKFPKESNVSPAQRMAHLNAALEDDAVRRWLSDGIRGF